MTTYLFLAFNGKTQAQKNLAKLVIVSGVADKKAAKSIAQETMPNMTLNCGWKYDTRAEAEQRAAELEKPVTAIDRNLQRDIARLLGL